MDSLSNFPESIAIGGPLLLAAIALIGAGVWLVRVIKRKEDGR